MKHVHEWYLNRTSLDPDTGAGRSDENALDPWCPFAWKWVAAVDQSLLEKEVEKEDENKSKTSSNPGV